ncbi:ARM repeat-containing protein [Fistulina hepatica ATCC 64428]|uniref:ARM repeat-containing protein n=1 Tax=Fistulina hepatica ATCC 64428 TaxID=1128425 RepID=A0A0D7A5F0_9AGAR|nr:ARM repeat-containing protein [Fistulina hepatica ATCC 64428]
MDESVESKLYASFEKYDDFRTTQHELLSGIDDEKQRTNKLQNLSNILNEYQEQSYLLDPFLDHLVPPVVRCIRAYAVSKSHTPQVQTTACLLYSYLTPPAARFFPHEVSDLMTVLEYMESIPGDLDFWCLRYVVLLWGSLICMLPFSLAQFDEEGREEQTADAIESLGKAYLGKSGLERESASVLLSRFYIRTDMADRFHSFVRVATASMTDIFTSMGVLQVLCEVTRLGSERLIRDVEQELFAVVESVDASPNLLSNTLARKLKTKLISRIGLRLLPARTAPRRRGRALDGALVKAHTAANTESDVPEAVEIVLEQLFSSLQDKDTIVRYSAAKGVARICERLPSDFIEQVLETILSLFSIHSVATASLYDVPAIAEATWHGACLACAEIARRDLFSPTKIPELMEWMSKALYFDVRKGAHSIGSNVRDAASYVLWAMARSQEPTLLVPYAHDLARCLVTVALYDREIHVRRAASAAFQEHVGRTGLFPHGIDVLRKTDFYAVSIRRNAFLFAAAQVAEHPEYRRFLFDHLLDVTLRHWDLQIRTLASESLQLICAADLDVLGPEMLVRTTKLLESTDNTDIHGALLALAELAVAYRRAKSGNDLDNILRKIFALLSRVPLKVIIGPRNEMVTSASCVFIARTITLPDIRAAGQSTVPGHWRQIVDYGLKHRSVAVQEASAMAMAAVNISPTIFNTMYNALMDGLNDYSMDERGDVGSWIRTVCVQGLASLSEQLIEHASEIATFAEYLPPERYHSAIGGILKQGVERLDNVRQEAGACFLRLLDLSAPDIPEGIQWMIEESTYLRDLFSGEKIPWSESRFIYPKAVYLLDVARYREPVLTGLVLAMGSKTGSTHRPVGNSLVAYARTLPCSICAPQPGASGLPSGQRYTLLALTRDLLERGTRHFTANFIFVPVLQTLNALLTSDVLTSLVGISDGVESLRSMHALASRNLLRMKSVQRVVESMKLVVDLMRFKTVRPSCVQTLCTFLQHQFPHVRAETAEYVYMFLQSVDIGLETDDAEEVLLETEW